MAMYSDQIAIVGIGCKVPGADNVEQYWKLLENGENHVIDIPKERWNNDAFYDPDPHAIGKSYVRRAGLLKDPIAFDNKLFNINDFEADQMDPQQRYVLDCSFMAMEDAGITRDKLAGSNTGVYVGAMNGDYRGLFTAKSSIVGNYTVTGISNSIIAARVSFVFDLRGPSMTLDTACSSALLAIHIGAQALRTGDCDIALCGGTNFLMSPDVFVHLSKAHMVSPTGQCFAFSDSADGYTRGEGCGMVILKRLKDALRDGDRVWATIDTGSNQDGHSVTPISAPSGDQQIKLLDHVYKIAGVDINKIDYIEAHGTGTSAGDPVEANALGKFFQEKGAVRHRYIGSVKTNLGHLESAAGTAGLIKVLLMMKHSKIVPSLFFDKPNPRINFPDMNLSVPTQVIDWPAQNKVACVNSFGFGGTNCHAVVQAYEDHMSRQNSMVEGQNIPCVVCFSAKHEKSLKGSIEDFVNHPEVSTFDVHDVSYTSSVRRDHYNVRYATVVEDMSELLARLNDYLSKGAKGSNAVRRARVVYVFGGMGTTWKGMCKELMNMSNEFRNAILEIDQYLSKYVTWSVASRFEKEADMDDPEFSPIAIFACQIGLAKLWSSLGVTPACVVGQSVGEVAAAYFAGILTMEDAVKVIYYRTSLMASVIGGKMFVVRNMPVDKVKDVVGGFSGLANVSLEYSPISCAVSGNSDIVMRIKQELQNKARNLNIQIQLVDLQVPVAYHSHHVDGCKAGLREALAGLAPKAPEIDMFSSVTGELATASLGPDYWVSNMREPVRFFDAVQKTFTKGYKNVYIEIGPKPVMRAHANDIFPKDDVMPVVSMSKPPEWKIFLQALVSVYELGCKVDWDNLPHEGKIVTPIPRYSFNPRRNLQLCESAHMILAGVHYMRKEHPFLNKVDTTNDWKAMVTQLTFPSVYDHIVSGMLIIPGAFYAETGFAVAMHTSEMNAPMYTVGVRFEQPCSFTREGAVELDLVLNKATPRGYGAEKYDSYNIAVVKGNKTFANIHLQAHNMRGQPSTINIRHIQGRCPQIVERDEIYGTLKSFGFTYGPAYALLMYAQRSSQECLAKIFVPKQLFIEIAGTTIHPSILDGMIQTSVILMDGVDDARDLLPRSIGKLTSYRPTENEMYIYTTLKSSDRKLTLYDIKLTTLYGEVIADLEDLAIKSLTDKSGGVENTYKCIWKPTETKYPNHETKKPNVLFITDSIPENTPSSMLKKCIQYDVLDEPGETVAKDMDLMLKNKMSEYEFIVIMNNTTISESEDAFSIQTKTLNLCMMLKNIYTFAVEKNLTLPIYLFTKRAFPFENGPPEVENINPIMTALWGMTRCALKEQVYTDLVTIDLHVSEETITLPYLSSVAEIINSDSILKNYPEWMVTADCMFVNQFVQVDSETPVPTFRHNFADKSQNVILLSKEPMVLTDTFPVYHETQVKDETQPHVQMDVSATAFQNPLLFNMKMLYSVMEKRRTLKGNGYPLFALENIGPVQGDAVCKRQRRYNIPAISCYPAPIGSKIKVPIDATIPADLIADYVPGDLTRLVLLWSLHELVTTRNATILASSATAKYGEILMCLLLSRRKPKPLNVNLVVVEELNNIETLNETIVSLVLMDENIVPIMARRWLQPKYYISVSSLLEPVARAPISFFLPTVEIKLLDTATVFHPHNVTTLVPRVKKWMVKHSSLMPRVAECLHKNPITTGIYKDAVADIDELLEVQITKMNSSVVRVEKTELFRKDAVYIVVGGLTGLGWLFVKFLAQNGAGNIAILNRRQATIEKTNEIAQLAASENCNIKALQADVTHMDSLKNFMSQMEQAFPNIVLKGVFFGAAVVDDQLLVQIDPKVFAKVMSPKVMGAWNLHQLTKDLPLDYFVLHSSVTSVIGNAGQTSYGAGNAFMDGMAHYRKHLKLSGQSINWGALDLGMLSDYSEAKKILEAQGFVLLTEEDISAVIIPILLLDWGQILPCKFDDEILLKRLKRDMLVPFQYRLKSMLGSAAEEVKIEEDILLALQTARELPPDQRVDVYERYVIALASQVLSAEDGAIKSDTNLVDMGMDSIVAMTMINQIYKEVHCRLPAIVFISGDPSVRIIAQAIDDVLSGRLAEGSEFGPDAEQLAIEAGDAQDNKEEKKEVKAIEPPPPKRRISFAASTIESSQLAIYKRHPRKQSLHGVVDVEIPDDKKDPSIVRQAILKTLELHPTACTAFKEDMSKRTSVMNFEKQVLPAEKAMDFRVVSKSGEEMQEFSEEAFDVKEKGPLRFVLQQGSKTNLRIIFHKAGFDVRAIYQVIQDLVSAFDPKFKKPVLEKEYIDKTLQQSEDFNMELDKIYKSKSESFAHFWAKTLSQDVANTSLRGQQTQFPPRPLLATNGSLRTVLSPELTQKMVNFIRFHHVSLLGLVAGAYQTLVHILTGKSTISLMFPVDLRRYITDLNNDVANYCNEIPLLAQFDDTNKVTIQEFIISNNKRIQQHIDHGMLPFTLFQGLAERTMEMFDQSPHGISIEMLADDIASQISNRPGNNGVKSAPAILPMGLETNLLIQHNLLKGVVVLNLGYKECVMNGMRAEVLMKNLVSLLTGVMTNPGLQLRQIKKYTKGVNARLEKKPFCAVQ
ncbi:mycocerosic acid synthase-like [Physella acuta]|uniref:mycocerosic acid synthase-like n=1 Tax=Physella acuta TaxID=109671 RepID=UPI0027DD17EC|nr:mycocerosic acid synthase-like [Physella acuta]